MYMFVIYDRKVSIGNSYWLCDIVIMVTVNVYIGYRMVDFIIFLLLDFVWFLFLVDF